MKTIASALAKANSFLINLKRVVNLETASIQHAEGRHDVCVVGCPECERITGRRA